MINIIGLALHAISWLYWLELTYYRCFQFYYITKIEYLLVYSKGRFTFQYKKCKVQNSNKIGIAVTNHIAQKLKFIVLKIRKISFPFLLIKRFVSLPFSFSPFAFFHISYRNQMVISFFVFISIFWIMSFSFSFPPFCFFYFVIKITYIQIRLNEVL